MKKSNLQIALSYISFLRKSKSVHGVHSPFLFDLIEAIRKSKNEPFFKKIEQERNRMLSDKSIVIGFDYGAGSRKKGNKNVSQIAKNALKSQKEAQFLYSISNHLKCKNIIELGTSLGISTCYLSYSNEDCKITSMEGNSDIIQQALKVFRNLDIRNIEVVEGNIDNTLEQTLSRIGEIDLAFIDANHQKEACLRYFHQILSNCHNDTVLIFDDIHWSNGMEEAWEQIKKDIKVQVSVDLFHFGLVLFRKEMSRQHFTIRV